MRPGRTTSPCEFGNRVPRSHNKYANRCLFLVSESAKLDKIRKLSRSQASGMPRGPPERCDSGIAIPRRADISNAQDGDTRGETNGSPLIGRAVIIETSFSVGASSPKRN